MSASDKLIVVMIELLLIVLMRKGMSRESIGAQTGDSCSTPIE